MESQGTTEGAIRKQDAQVEIWASWSTVNYIKAEIVGLSEFGAKLMFAETFVRRMGNSSKPAINLRLQMQHTQALTQVRGIVTTTRSVKGFVILNIEFLNSRGNRVRLPTQAFATFNRRATARAILPSHPRTEVNITNTTANQELTAALRDISEGGARMLFYGPECPASGDRLILKFVLPYTDSNFSLIARVVKQFSLAGVKSCSVQFSTVGEEYKIQQLEIRQFVSDRLAELTEAASAEFSD